ncbi:hypothetical protein MHYP_G00229640 [Metynnis hypsauchen]
MTMIDQNVPEMEAGESSCPSKASKAVLCKPTWCCRFWDPSEGADLAQLESCFDLMAAVCMTCPRPAQSGDQQPANPNAC